MAKVDQQFLYKHVIIIWNDTDVDIIRGALYNEQHFWIMMTSGHS